MDNKEIIKKLNLILEKAEEISKAQLADRIEIESAISSMEKTKEKSKATRKTKAKVKAVEPKSDSTSESKTSEKSDNKTDNKTVEKPAKTDAKPKKQNDRFKSDYVKNKQIYMDWLSENQPSIYKDIVKMIEENSGKSDKQYAHRIWTTYLTSTKRKVNTEFFNFVDSRTKI